MICILLSVGGESPRSRTAKPIQVGRNRILRRKDRVCQTVNSEPVFVTLSSNSAFSLGDDLPIQVSPCPAMP
jgi:hypothetical protein